MYYYLYVVVEIHLQHKYINMKNNEELQTEVQDSIKWEPLLKAAEIGVTANNGIVTLSGYVDSYAKKSEAENAAKSVAGVKAVVQEIEIKFSNSWNKNNNDIAKDVLNALRLNWQVPADKIKVEVEDGWITLEGEVQWNFQKESAKGVIETLMGVKGVINNITIKAQSPDSVEKRGIESALRRNGSIDDNDIQVIVSGTKVTLRGDVNSWYEKDEAARIAWNAPGVLKVDNELVVEYNYSLADN